MSCIPRATVVLRSPAREGFTANPAALEHNQAFCWCSGPGTFDAEIIPARWDSPTPSPQPGLGLKQHLLVSTHPAIDRAVAVCRRSHISRRD